MRFIYLYLNVGITINK